MIPAMTPKCVHEYLYEVGRNWIGQGVAIEFGCWLGASTVALGSGLKEANYNRPFYCFDRWIANSKEVLKARYQGLEIKFRQNLLPIFLENAKLYFNDIRAVRGNLSKTFIKWNGDPIEICLFDAPKRNPIFAHVMKRIVGSFIPDVTILGLLDYYSYKRKRTTHEANKFKVQIEFIERNNFEFLIDWHDECECAFFKYKGGEVTIPE